jgi:hypothetical protein
MMIRVALVVTIALACAVANAEIPEDSFTQDASPDAVLEEVQSSLETDTELHKAAAKKPAKKAKVPATLIGVMQLKAYCMVAYPKAAEIEEDGADKVLSNFGKITKFITIFGDPKKDKENAVMGFASSMAEFRNKYAYNGVNAYLAKAINKAVLTGEKMLRLDRDGGEVECSSSSGLECFEQQMVINGEAMGLTQDPRYLEKLSAAVTLYNEALIKVREQTESFSNGIASLAWIQEGAKGAYSTFTDQVQNYWLNKELHMQAMVVQDAQRAAHAAYARAKAQGKGAFIQADTQSPAAFKASIAAAEKFATKVPNATQIKELAKEKAAAWFKKHAFKMTEESISNILKKAVNVEQGVQVKFQTGQQLHSGSIQTPLLKVEGKYRNVHHTIKAVPLAGEMATATMPSEDPVGKVKHVYFTASGSDGWNFVYVGVRGGTKGPFTKFVPCDQMRMCKTLLPVNWLSTKHKRGESCAKTFKLCPCAAGEVGEAGTDGANSQQQALRVEHHINHKMNQVGKYAGATTPATPASPVDEGMAEEDMVEELPAEELSAEDLEDSDDFLA